jgi:23S rRNA (cytosine1962-C5)-methyltransferase
MRRVLVKPGREHSLNCRHPWIFSGAIDALPSCEKGEILPVYSAEGVFLAQAYFNPDNSLIGRAISFQQGDIQTLLKEKLQRAWRFRSSLHLEAFRLINGEGDGFPGLIVDCYRDVMVIQISTWGIERLRSFLLQELIRLASPRCLYEKSLSAARLQEGLEEKQEMLFGPSLEEVQFREGDLLYTFSLPLGQKTGFFLDQREMRHLVRSLAFGKKVLNCFCYTGGFSLQALKGDAKKVLSIDSSASALHYLERNVRDNHLEENHTLLRADLFDYLPSLTDFSFDFVILDPPALVKKQGDLQQGLRAYRSLHTAILRRLPPGGLLLTSSCSSYLTQELFEKLVRTAVAQGGREAQILARHRAALDHPVMLSHPEGDYLKSFLLQVY